MGDILQIGVVYASAIIGGYEGLRGVVWVVVGGKLSFRCVVFRYVLFLLGDE